MKLVEKYIISSLSKCHDSLLLLPIEEVQKYMMKLYQNDLDQSLVTSYVQFDDQLILSKDSELTDHEIEIGTVVKAVQEKHAKMSEEQNGERSPSSLESYGGYGFFGMILAIVIILILIYSVYSRKGNEESRAILGLVNEIKIRRRGLAKQEEELKEEIENIKTEINTYKKST